MIIFFQNAQAGRKNQARVMAMSRIVYVNGEYLPQADAKISVFDRGYLFGDGVYEVIPIIRGKLVDEEYGVQRLRRSLAEIEIAWPCSEAEYLQMLRELISRNNVEEGMVYVQVTRGIAERDFAYPKDTRSSLMAYPTHKAILQSPLAESGVTVVSTEDLRWKRRDIKSLNLLAQCMAKQQAAKLGAFEAWMTEDGFVTEGASSTAYIVKNGTVITRALSNSILPGIRRRVLVEMAEQGGFKLEQRAFSIEEAKSADEAFLSNASSLVLPIVSVDGNPIGNGKPGPVTRDLRARYIAALLAEAASK
jgi:D-alanine transaminase